MVTLGWVNNLSRRFRSELRVTMIIVLSVFKGSRVSFYWVWCFRLGLKTFF